MLKKISIIFALTAATLVGGCQYQLSQTSAQGWGQIAAGAGQVIGKTSADPKIQKSLDQLYAKCDSLRLLAAAGVMLAPEKQRKAAQIASAAIDGVCLSPPSEDLTAVQAALTTAIKAYEAAIAVQKTVPASGGSI